jgi:hypothetical protein
MFLSIFVEKDRINLYKHLTSLADMRRYELIADQLGLIPFLNTHIPKKSKQYDDIKRNIKSATQSLAKESLYKTGVGFYEAIKTDNSFHHCKRFLTKEGVEGKEAKEMISGAVVCSLIDYILNSNQNVEGVHNEVLEDRLGIEAMVYLETPI